MLFAAILGSMLSLSPKLRLEWPYVGGFRLYILCKNDKEIQNSYGLHAETANLESTVIMLGDQMQSLNRRLSKM